MYAATTKDLPKAGKTQQMAIFQQPAIKVR
jgi:hypothetical protein